MEKFKRWTKEEERVLADQLKRHASLSEGFKKAGFILNRTPNACKCHWYSMEEVTRICLLPEPKDKLSLLDKIKKLFIKIIRIWNLDSK